MPMATSTHRKTGKPRGFTLVELAVTVGIAGILASLAFSGMQEFGKRAAPQSAAYDFVAALSKARARATQRGGDVWVIVYPGAAEGGGAGSGAWFVFDDPDLTFAGDDYNNFSPTNLTLASARGRLIEAVYLDDYAKKNVRFGPPDGAAPEYPQPFAALAVADCGFCTGNGPTRRGALVFSGDGGTRFLASDGVAAAPGTDAAGNAAALSLSARATTQQSFLIAVSGPTSFIGVYRQ